MVLEENVISDEEPLIITERSETITRVIYNGKARLSHTILHDNGEVKHKFKDVIVRSRLAQRRNKLEKIYKDGERIYRFGERGSGFYDVRVPVQDFCQLRAQCLAEQKLFEDPYFPPEDSSIYYSNMPKRNFQWLRPSEISDNPQLFVKSFSRFDVMQGELGNCWLVAAMASLTLHKKLFFRIVPDCQSFEENYAGIFHFRFWQYGRWVEIVIDDRLPTINGKLVYLHSSERNEFWSALLEKAFAKLHGSYEALQGGSACEAMEDFTGGVTEVFEMSEAPENLYTILLQGYQRGSLMGCTIEPDPEVLEARTPEGLVRGHAYSITRVCYAEVETPNRKGKVPLLRLRNPWGNEAEWNGAWSDKSQKWTSVTPEVKKELELTSRFDGEFWMSYEDFKTFFNGLEICNLGPGALDEEDVRKGCSKQWDVSVFQGEWVKGVTAGGCRKHPQTFWKNPQYTLTLTDPDEDDDVDLCTVIVSLMQKNRRSKRSQGVQSLTIGFMIYKLPEETTGQHKPLPLEFFKFTVSAAKSQSYVNLREITSRFMLPPGNYCIVPSTLEPDEEGEFILRVFTEKSCSATENDEEIGFTQMDITTLYAFPGSDDDPLKAAFLEQAGVDGELDWLELKSALDKTMKNEIDEDGFSKNICRSMVAMLDADGSGKLGFSEFKKLWIDIQTWKTVFKVYDVEEQGKISTSQLRDCIRSAGYTLNNHILNILAHRYGSKDGHVAFDDFIMCTVRLKTMIDTFYASLNTDSGKATFTLEEWIKKTVYS